MSTGRLVNLGDGLAARVAPGDGDKVFWVHPYALDSGCWGEVWAGLPAWHHVGIDLPGHGASLPLKAGEDLPALARALGRLALGQAARHLVALSCGTLVALQMAVEFPTAFATVLLASPVLGGGLADPGMRERVGELKSSYRERGFGPHLRERWMASPPDVFRGARGRPELWRRLWLQVGRHGWWELADDTCCRLANHVQAEGALRRVTAATLVVVGEHDLDGCRRGAALLQRAIPGCRRRDVPGLGHLALLEDPRQAAAIIEHHLRGRQGDPPASARL